MTLVYSLLLVEYHLPDIFVLQAFTPVAILLISWTFRIQDPNKKLAIIVFMISSGVALASHGEMKFNLMGFLFQASAVAVSITYSFILETLNIRHSLKPHA